MDLADFQGGYPFRFDDFQTEACRALEGGRSVLVCAPTGAGKTVVGEFAVWLALQRSCKCFYTTPLKALSNQKFGDFIARHGAANVGLLTGDNSINGEAPIVVMTTEVLRNMLYEGSPTLGGLGFVVMDEVHYLKDPYRGAVWEEVLIHLPETVRVAALSATVSNAEEFGEWLATVRGDTDVVIEDRRPVPLEHFVMAGERLLPMFVREGEAASPNPALRRLADPDLRRAGGRRGQAPRRRRFDQPGRVEVIELLNREGMLPAITFIFSRAGCDQAVRQSRQAHVRLVDDDEGERIREYVELRAAVLPQEDLAVLGYEDWLDGLRRGVAAHHAGLIPLFKETVEELFERGLVRAVFATETLSLGINMPAKTVVIERLVKFTGERHEMLTPSDYTQLTGRAGRRGIDPVGYGVVLAQRDIPSDRIVALAGARAYPLVSSFRPSYNMAVNLVRHFTVEEATRLLNLSFGQFLTDRSVVRQERQIERNERFLAGYREQVACERGDFGEYWEMVRAARAAEREAGQGTGRPARRRVRQAVEEIRPGQVVHLNRRGKLKRGSAVVIEIRRGKAGQVQLVVVGQDARVAKLGSRDFAGPPEVLGEVRVPRGDSRNPRFRREVARRLARLEGSAEGSAGSAGSPAGSAGAPPGGHPSGGRVPGRGPAPPAVPSVPAASALARIRAHPCHACPDRAEHERWAERADELEAETTAMRGRVRKRTETLARTFERVLEVLRLFGYVSGEALTPKGERLCRIYNESDLLVAEAMEQGIFDDLEVPDLTALASTLVYETRGLATETAWPADRVRRAFGRLMRAYRRIREAEETHTLDLCREPDSGFVEQMWWWAKDEPLEDVLDMGDLSAGDFVRASKQVWDLLRQLAEVAPSEALAERCRQAARTIYRGVVAYSGAL